MNCRSCRGSSVEVVIDFGTQPVVHKLISDKSIEYSEYDRAVGLCRKCGFVQLISPIFADILYQDYFTLSSWKNQPQANGFKPIFMEAFTFSGRALVIIAERCRSKNGYGNERLWMKGEIERVLWASDLWPKFRELYRQHVDSIRTKEGNIGIYGCGARSSTITNFLNLDDYISCFIDDQKEKQGLFVPGAGLEICSKQAIVDKDIKHIILGVNAENEDSVIRSAQLNNNSISWDSILPPSRFLPQFWCQLAKDKP